MRIPERQECYRIIHTMEMMDHIVAHSLQVCRVALFLSDSLEANLNPDLVQAAALLHDITKTRGIETHENHAQTGKQTLIDLGYPEVGAIIGQHVLLTSILPRTGRRRRRSSITLTNGWFMTRLQRSRNG